MDCVFQPPHVRTKNKIRETNKTLRERISRLEERLSKGDSQETTSPTTTSPPAAQIHLPTSPAQPNGLSLLSPRMSQTLDMPVQSPTLHDHGNCDGDTEFNEPLAPYALLSSPPPTDPKVPQMVPEYQGPQPPLTPGPSQAGSVVSPSLVCALLFHPAFALEMFQHG